MTSKKYFHVGFGFTREPLGPELEPAFNKYGDDWIRYNGNCWIIYTKYNSEDLLKAFKVNLAKSDTVLILEITQQQKISGWLPEWIWTWLHKQRS